MTNSNTLRHRPLQFGGGKAITGMIGNYSAWASVGLTSATDPIIQEFTTSWIVPTSPNPGQKTLFLWNGLQSDSNRAGLIQPVLTWDPNEKSWNVSCWYTKDDKNYVRGDGVSVVPGESLQARISFVSQTENAYTYTMEFVGSKFASTKVTVDMPSAMNLLLECFEPYTDDWHDLPPDELVRMTNINVKLVPQGNFQPKINNLKWNFYNNGIVTPSGKNGAVINNSAIFGEIDFYFR
ncbi:MULTISPECIES: hypothetical protein [Brucella/Ochrobactrum group]|jgi:hypothetical protein|uniref:hypothetical protein n=1 Tax=Brucella/Ochrobactrum group TaxID=2826938 RepID=UPI001C049F45|nr:hypothetical protein [Brucella sp. NBRC 12950]QWK80343.1 hypothetical protein KMS41_21525 [Ochrobactrum sp. BTU1]GLU27582.1 hypothetical protein Brsp01_28150 [Brucella sp. NBRC 12950]